MPLIKNQSSAVIDEISSYLLKACKDELLLYFLLEILSINRVYWEYSPTNRKVSKVLPYSEKGNRTEGINYGPISLYHPYNL